MSRKYKFHEAMGAYFISFATVNWIDVFTREVYFGAMIESLDYCRKTKAWNFMDIASCQAIYI
jgi:hypothetical protein